jgi:hypothetical protein
MAIALLVLGAFVAVAIIISAMSSRDTARRELEAGASEQLVRDAGTAIAEAYDASESGEFDGYVPRRSVMVNHASRLEGGHVIGNPAGYTNVSSTIPNDANHRYTVVQTLDDGREGLWQLYAVDVPTWGVTPNALVKVYVRAWTRKAGGGLETKPLVYELSLRPEWFADYQILVDGKLRLGSSATVSGRVHSNGTSSSIFNSDRNEPWQISIGESGDAANCNPGAKITSTVGPIAYKAACEAGGGTVDVVPDQHVNILRASDAVQRMREMCPGGSIPTPRLNVVCPIGNATVTVKLLGSGNVLVNGGSHSANVVTNGNQGLVVIANGDVKVRGNGVGPNARLTIAAVAPAYAQRYGSGGRAPSVYMGSMGNFGASNSP